MTATGSPVPTFSESGTLPRGLAFNSSTGILSGTPAAGTGGTYAVTFTAANGVGRPASQTFHADVDQAPAITSVSNATFTVGSAASFTVTASGFPAATLGESGALPTGVTFNASTGVLSGTPAVGTAGTYNLTFTASNGVGSAATQSFTLTVNQAPAITSASNATFTDGTAGSMTVTASGFPTSTLGESGTLPSGINFNATRGMLSGIPAAGTGGTYALSFTAANGVGQPASQSFALTIDQAPAITSASNATFTVGSAGSFTVAASGFPAATLSESGALPTGVTFNASTGVLSGTPAAGTGGTRSDLHRHKRRRPAGQQEFHAHRQPGSGDHRRQQRGLQRGKCGELHRHDERNPSTHAQRVGSVANRSGVQRVDRRVERDTGGRHSWDVQPDIHGFQRCWPRDDAELHAHRQPGSGDHERNNAVFSVGSVGSFTVTASGSPRKTLGESGTLPAGVTFNASTGVLSGTPAAGTGGTTYAVSFTAANGVGQPASQSFTLTIDQAPAITSVSNATFAVGSAGSFTVAASGFPAATLSESGALPTGVTFNASTGVLSGTPAAGTGGTYALTFTAANGVGQPGSQNFTFTVNQAPAITSANTATFTVGTAGSLTVADSGFPAPTLSEAGALPAGLAFNAAAGVLSGTPGAGTAGTYTLTFTASNGVGSAATQSFALQVNNAAASNLVFVQTPSTGTAGQVLSPAVQVAVEDQFGDVVTSDNSIVTLTPSSGGFSGGAATAQVVNGVATFGNLVIGAAGTDSLSASDGSLTGATSGSITINALQQSVTFNLQQGLNGYTGMTDTYLTDAKSDDTVNYVTSTTLSAAGPQKNEQDALLLWNLSSVSGTIQSASITVYVTTGSTATYNLYALNRSWNPSQVTFDQPANGQFWQSAGANGSADYNSTVLGTLQSTGTGFATITLNAAGIAQLQSWISNPSSNYGFIVKDPVSSDKAVITFASSKYATIVDRPLLTIIAQSSVPPAGQSSTPGISLASGTTSAVNAPSAGQGSASSNAAATGSPSNVSRTLSTGLTVNASMGLLSDTTASNPPTTNPAPSASVAVNGNGALPNTGLIAGVGGNQATVSKLVFLQTPTTGTAGQVLSPAVQVAVQNQAGNIVTSDNSMVTLTLNGGVFAGDETTATAQAVNGVATFSNLILNKIGSYTLSASDGSLTATISSPITINPAAASKLVFLQVPTTGTIGPVLSPSLIIAVEDRFGNLVTSDNSTITLTLSRGVFAGGRTIRHRSGGQRCGNVQRTRRRCAWKF